MKLAEDTIGEADLVILPAAVPVTVAADAYANMFRCDGAAGCFTFGAEGNTSAGGDGDSSGAFLGSAASLPLLNSTAVSNSIESVGSAAGAAPRWLLLGDLLNAKDRSRNTSVLVLAIDSRAEDRISLGKQWMRRPLGYLEGYAVSRWI